MNYVFLVLVSVYKLWSGEKKDSMLPVPDSVALAKAALKKSSGDVVYINNEAELTEIIENLKTDPYTTLVVENMDTFSDVCEKAGINTEGLDVTCIDSLRYVAENGLNSDNNVKIRDEVDKQHRCFSNNIPKFKGLFLEIALREALKLLEQYAASYCNRIITAGQQEFLKSYIDFEGVLFKISNNRVPVGVGKVSDMKLNYEEQMRTNLAILQEHLGDVGLFDTKAIRDRLKGASVTPEQRAAIRAINHSTTTYNILLKHTSHIINGRIKTRYSRYQTSGRVSVTRPNIIGIPKEHRGIFKAPEGKVIIYQDMGNVEMRSASSVFNCQQLRQDCLEQDYYELMANVLFTESERQNLPLLRETTPRSIAKRVCLGWLYGQRAEGCSKTTGLPLDVAHRIHNTLRDRYQDLEREVSRRMIIARTNGYVETRKGLRRYLPCNQSKIENSIRNFFVQAEAAQSFCDAVKSIHELLCGTGSKIVFIIHDGLGLEAPSEDSERVAREAGEILRRQYENDFPGLMFPVSVTIGDTWEG